MTSSNLKRAIALGTSLGMILPSAAFATNGMLLIGQSTKARGMGGTAIASHHDAIASAANPAIMAHVGNQFNIGGDIFVPQAEARLGSVTVESKPDHLAISDSVYFMPSMAAAWESGNISYGFSFVSVGGGGSRYDTNLYNAQLGRDTRPKLGVSLIIANLNPTIAMKLNETHTIGASLIIGMQVFKSYGLTEFSQFTISRSNDYLTDNGAEMSYGAGIRLGWLGSYMNGNLTLGAEFTSKTYMSEFDKYKELFAENGDIDTPGNIGVGINYKVNDKLAVAFDINYIMYEQVASIGNIGPNTGGALFPVSPEVNELGRSEGLGFGWENQTVFKVGAEYKYSPKTTLRAGWNYGASPIDESREIIFNIVAPATTQHHLTMGASYQYDKETEFSLSYVHAFEFEQYGPTYIGDTGEISMSQDSIGMSMIMQF